MNNNSIKRCCLCEKIIPSGTNIFLTSKDVIIPGTNRYLCQDCCMEAAIVIDDIMNPSLNKDVPIKIGYQKLGNIIKKEVEEKSIIRSTVANAIIVDNDPYSPKIFLKHTKKEVFDIVTQKVKYQDTAIKRIIRTIYSNLCVEDYSFKENILLIGGTGVGKTFSVSNILDTWEIPYVIVDSNEFTETGYIGKSVDDAIEALYKVCRKNSELASRGVVVFDEIDKLRLGETSSRDVSGQSVQEELLTLLTGKKVEINSSTFVDTSFITFILMGAFDDTCESGKLSEIRKKRIERGNNSKIGFNTEEKEEVTLPQINSYIAQDLNEYGIISQLSGRCSTIIEFNNFNEEMCRTILFNSSSSKLNHIFQKFKMLNVALDISPEILNSTCKYIVELGFGARGIAQFLTELFTPALEKIEDDLDNNIAEYESCVITEETLTNHSSFDLIPKSLSYTHGQWI